MAVNLSEIKRQKSEVGWDATHVVFCLVDPSEEEQLGNEKVDAEVLVDGVAVRLQAPQEAERGDADGQTH